MRLPEQLSIALPRVAGLKTSAAWPVCKDSLRADVKFHPLPKRQAVRLYHEARRFERQTRKPGLQVGAIGRNGLALLHAMHRCGGRGRTRRPNHGHRHRK